MYALAEQTFIQPRGCSVAPNQANKNYPQTKPILHLPFTQEITRFIPISQSIKRKTITGVWNYIAEYFYFDS